MWKFDPATVDLIWAETVETIQQGDGVILDLTASGDMLIDLGDANNTDSFIELGIGN